ncbi:MAG: TraR/DksA family transcriptional regulator [Pirellulales bacterium]
MRKANVTRFKNELLGMRNRLTGEVHRLIEAVPARIQGAGELSHVPTHNADRDSEGLENELILIHNEENLLGEVDAALNRIEGGSFGSCLHCGQLIPEARLTALPYTALCIHCAQQEQQTRIPTA